MHIFPAIDLKDDQVVRLTQGDFDQVKVYAQNPAVIAAQFQAKGAKHLHVVDLDGAKDGRVKSIQKIKDITALGGMFVEIGGGIRDRAAIEAYLELGVSRVILGTVAVENFSFLEEAVKAYGDKIAVGVDARNGLVSVRGWQLDSGLDSLDFCARLEQAGVSTIIYTDISRDGLMQGVNLEAMEAVNRKVSCDVIASGGVTTLEDIKALVELEMAGAIVGKALYEGTLDLREVLSLC